MVTRPCEKGSALVIASPGLWAQGQFAAAQASSAAAKKWAIWSVVATVAVYIIAGILIAVGAINMDFETTSY